MQLLAQLRAWLGRQPEYPTLVLISLSSLPIAGANSELFSGLTQALAIVRQRYSARTYDLSPPDRAILVKMSDYNEVRIISDLKLELLRLIQQHFPDHFGLIDQSRLIRIIDLRMKLANAIAFLERYENVPTNQPVEAPAKPQLRPLHPNDLRMVEDISRKVGKADFARAFIRSQPVAQIAPGQAPVPVMNEYFVSMDLLKRHVFKDVELRGSGNLFNQMTIILDQILLGAFREANPKVARCSINLNVESVFTRGFEEFLANIDENLFSNVMFEFRQSNILQQYDEFEVACNVIQGRHGTVAVDAIFPETIGIVNLDRLKAGLAKIFWRQGADAVLPRYADSIRYLLDAGVSLVLARLDDETGVEIGHGLGITMFQGFYIDRLLSGGR
jgi:hypothetical protein